MKRRRRRRRGRGCRRRRCRSGGRGRGCGGCGRGSCGRRCGRCRRGGGGRRRGGGGGRCRGRRGRRRRGRLARLRPAAPGQRRFHQRGHGSQEPRVEPRRPDRRVQDQGELGGTAAILATVERDHVGGPPRQPERERGIPGDRPGDVDANRAVGPERARARHQAGPAPCPHRRAVAGAGPGLQGERRGADGARDAAEVEAQPSHPAGPAAAHPTGVGDGLGLDDAEGAVGQRDVVRPVVSARRCGAGRGGEDGGKAAGGQGGYGEPAQPAGTGGAHRGDLRDLERRAPGTPSVVRPAPENGSPVALRTRLATGVPLSGKCLS